MSTSADPLNNGAIPAINFSKLFSQEELHAKLVESKKLLNVHQILNIEKTHFWIYAICFGISTALILLYLLDCCSYLASLLSVLMSIGAGGISAVLADKCLPQIRALPFIRIPAALYRWRRVRVRWQGRLVVSMLPVIFRMLHSDFLLKYKKAETSKRNPGSLRNITLSVPLRGAAPVPAAAE